jgi:hypothetical protein
LRPGTTITSRNELYRVRHWSEIVNNAFFVVRKFEGKRLEASDEAKELHRQQNIVDKEIIRINKKTIAAENKRKETPPEQKAFKNQQNLFKSQAKAAELRVVAVQYILRQKIMAGQYLWLLLC